MQVYTSQGEKLYFECDAHVVDPMGNLQIYGQNAFWLATIPAGEWVYVADEDFNIMHEDSGGE